MTVPSAVAPRTVTGDVPRAPDAVDERYGTGPGRRPFLETWRSVGATAGPVGAEPATVVDGATSTMLRLGDSTPQAWWARPLTMGPASSLVVELKVRCPSEYRGPSFVVGVRVGRRTFLVRQGAFTGAWNHVGPLGQDDIGRRVRGFNVDDWHVWFLRWDRAADSVTVLVDGETVGSFGATIDPLGGSADELIVGALRTGQTIAIDRAWVAASPMPVRAGYLPAIRAGDWEIRAGEIAFRVGRVRRRSEPVLRPGPPGSHDAAAAYDAWVVRDGDRFRMWYAGRAVVGPGRPLAIFTATSPDGVTWNRSDPAPAVAGGPPGAWDAGGVQSPVVRGRPGAWTMWYAGYVDGATAARTGIAHSVDGRQWAKPALGDHTFGGTATNIVYGLQLPPYESQYAMPQTVIVDDDAPPERRYLLFVHAQGTAPVIGIAASADGTAFERIPGAARLRADAGNSDEIGRLHQRTAVVHRDGWWFAFFGLIRPRTDGAGLETWFTAWPDEDTDGANMAFGSWRAYPVLLPRRGRWDGHFAWPTSVIDDGDTWRLWYTGSNGPFDGAVGLATVQAGALWWAEASTPAGALIRSRPFPCGPGWGARAVEVMATVRHGATATVAAVLPGSGETVSGGEPAPLVRRVGTTDPGRAAWYRPAWPLGEGVPPDVASDLAFEIALGPGVRLHAIRIVNVEEPS